jgi:ceramidase
MADANIVRMKDGRWRYWMIFAMAGASVLGLALHKAIPQDDSYHMFADRRTVLGIPNFWNVVSSLPFLLIGIAGLRALREHGSTGALRPLYLAYATFFVGAILTAFGSAYYHLNPDTSTLTWDRLPMGVVFMAFVAIIVGEHIEPQLGRRCLPFLVLIGIFSVAYWQYTELLGRGDLRLYVLVQFLPMLLVPLIMLLFPSRLSKVYFIWGIVGAYAAAKILEVLDERIYRAVGILSGHTLKHLAAAAGVYLLVLAVQQRSVVIRIGSARAL